jgi:hypothetical protein
MSNIDPAAVQHGHTDEATAYVVDDYPYGRSRTQIRYWIESVKNKGDRFCAQTLNPKTGRWNKPKKSTYSAVLAMYLEEQPDGRMFVKTTGLGLWRTDEDAQAFIDLVGRENLNDVQRIQLAKVLGTNKVMQHVTFTVHEGEYTEEDKQKGLENQRLVNRAIAVESFRAHQEL